jgi:endonuclease/exonuclease/phosphatase family metal-dependent hydrolase
MTKIVSFNLKQISQTHYNTKHNAFLHILLNSNADIICLQETNKKLTAYLTKDITIHTKIKYHFKYIENNAIITHYPIISAETKLIVINNVYTNRSYITLKLDDPKLKCQYKITVFHLDHLSETTRMMQLDQMDDMLKTTDILVGDFNSIKKEDYSENFIKKIYAMRKTACIEKPEFQVIERIEDIGFRTNKFKMETCFYATRVDYIFMKPSITDKFNLVDGVVNYIKSNVTDHNMIWTIIYPESTIIV